MVVPVNCMKVGVGMDRKMEVLIPETYTYLPSILWLAIVHLQVPGFLNLVYVVTVQTQGPRDITCFSQSTNTCS